MARIDRTPDEIRVEIKCLVRAGRQIATALTFVALLALVFTMVNVTLFAAHEGVPWFIAWLLDPVASVALGSMILAEGVLARYECEPGRWVSITKWFSGLATWAMNIWSSAVAGAAAGVLLHSIAPGIVLGLAEAAPWVRRQLATVVGRLERQLAEDEEALVREQAERAAAQATEAREKAAAERTERLARIEQERLERQTLELARMEMERLERLEASASAEAVMTPPVRRRSRGGRRQVERQAAPDLNELIELARPLVEQGLGREKIQEKLQISAHWARKAVEGVRAGMEERPLRAVGRG